MTDIDIYKGEIPLAVVGINHRTAAVNIRERASLSETECNTYIHEFQTLHDSCGVMILSTCNRTELYFSGKEAIGRLHELLIPLDKIKKQKLFLNEKITYTYHGRKAVHHFFRVISSLDSQMIGEPQITGQVKDAYETACVLKSTDILINKLYNYGMQTEKIVRSRTYLTDGAVSVSFAGVELARKIFSDLDAKTVLLLGAGETAELAAVHFLKRKVNNLLVVNRTFSKAQTLANKIGGKAILLKNLESILLKSDIVISATSSDTYVVDREMLKRVAKQRDYKPIFLIDLAVPRDIDPTAKKLDGIFLFDLDSLQGIVEKNISKRKSEIPRAEKIIEYQVEAYTQWYDALPVTATITKLNSFFEEIREKEYERLKNRFPIESRAEAEYLTKSLMKKFLHQHIMTLRQNSKNQSRRKQHIDLVSEIYLKNGSENNNEE